jgi:uncharacterized membrane protein
VNVAVADAVTTAAIQTAKGTLELAQWTAILACITAGSVIVSIVLQIVNASREDRLRRADVAAAERARQEQYAEAERLRQRDRDDARSDRTRRDEALRSQFLHILRSYESYMRLLEAIQHQDIAAQVTTAATMFARAFAADMGEAIPVADRDSVYRALVKGHETLNAAIVQQQMHSDRLNALKTEARKAAEFRTEYAAAQALFKFSASQLNRDNLDILAASPQAIDARVYEATHEERGKQLSGFYVAIKVNAADAAGRLAAARALLKDDVGPLPPFGTAPIQV